MTCYLPDVLHQVSSCFLSWLPPSCSYDTIPCDRCLDLYGVYWDKNNFLKKLRP